MRKQNLLLAVSMILTVCISCSRQTEQKNAQAATEAIRQQIAKYTAALDAADVGIASQVWDTSPEVSFISPAGQQHGWEEVKGVYAFFGSMFSERKLTARDISVHVIGDDAAWAEFYWHFVGKQKNDGAQVQTDGRETQVYRKRDGRWALVHVHYSGPAQIPGSAQ